MPASLVHLFVFVFGLSVAVGVLYPRSGDRRQSEFLVTGQRNFEVFLTENRAGDECRCRAALSLWIGGLAVAEIPARSEK